MSPSKKPLPPSSSQRTPQQRRKGLDGCKRVDVRIAEACEIYANLRKMGVFQSPVNRTTISDASNEFIRNGVGSVLRVRADGMEGGGGGSGMWLLVSYNVQAGKPSGIELA